MSGHSRTVIVTGGGGAGCGRAIAMCFGLRGDAVVVSDIDEDGGAEAVSRIERRGGRARFFRADVRDESQVRDLVAFAERTFRGVHVLVNNASAAHHDEGVQHWMEPVETDLRQWTVADLSGVNWILNRECMAREPRQPPD
jgi:NAD(P)-dependent dehydrogenase (short-subunit alcohol dehydrogenase family)